ncbi:hypothetical protein BOTBODRAFT_515253 [Botryobasidium botryosum FD-172 SS1]|uniref:Uncharacterized protein n=1 Tax=Botryobasidium botryosum (strain FD-172 SS1) TaxID=930990 RepID=A0A067N456_BOTB1|nr:hypothetical protein BOTBODRAFT_515253 [Botryobasidium botryosum FD-172 SS1]
MFMVKDLFVDKPLAPEHKADLEEIEAILTLWLLAYQEVEEGIEGGREEFVKANEELATLKLSPEYTFTPAPPQRFRSALLSIAKCYWMAAVRSLSRDQLFVLVVHLNSVEPFGDSIPRFDGVRAVERPGELTALEYAGLIQTAVFTLGMADQAMIPWWRTFSEVAARTWEQGPFSVWS